MDPFALESLLPTETRGLTPSLRLDPQRPWAEQGWLPALREILSTSLPAPLEDTYARPVEEAYASGIERMGTAGPPVGLLDYLAGLGNVAGQALGMRGGLDKPPLTKVMTGGKPTRVYHGTPKVFETMDPTKSVAEPLYGPGLYFTENPQVASGYAKKLAAGERAPNVRPAYLDITNPFDMDANVTPAIIQNLVRGIEAAALKHKWWSPNTPLAHIKAWAEKVGESLVPVLPVSGMPLHSKLTNAAVYNRLARKLGSDPEYPAKDWVNQALRAAGYDGITHIGGKISGGEAHRVWIAFDPKQVHNPFEFDALQYKKWLEGTQHRD